MCVKGLDFLHEDLSVRLVEWIELLNLLGADKVFFYELQVHPNISKVLRHYENEGKVMRRRNIIQGILAVVSSHKLIFLQCNM